MAYFTLTVGSYIPQRGETCFLDVAQLSFWLFANGYNVASTYDAGGTLAYCDTMCGHRVYRNGYTCICRKV